MYKVDFAMQKPQDILGVLANKLKYLKTIPLVGHLLTFWVREEVAEEFYAGVALTEFFLSLTVEKKKNCDKRKSEGRRSFWYISIHSSVEIHRNVKLYTKSTGN